MLEHESVCTRFHLGTTSERLILIHAEDGMLLTTAGDDIPGLATPVFPFISLSFFAFP
jgi:hypothetical protein